MDARCLKCCCVRTALLEPCPTARVFAATVLIKKRRGREVGAYAQQQGIADRSPEMAVSALDPTVLLGDTAIVEQPSTLQLEFLRRNLITNPT